MWNPPGLRRPHAVHPPAIGGGGQVVAPPVPPQVGGRTATGDLTPEPPLEVEYSLSRSDLQPVLRSIRESLGLGATALDSPARLQGALATLLRSLGGRGEPSVRRSPATLLTPEYWHVRIAGTDAATLAAIGGLIRREPVARGPLE